MNRTIRISRAIAVSVVATIGCLVLADTGSPPPPSLSESSLISVTRAQTRAYRGAVLPTYHAWLAAGSRTNTYPAFLLFLATYPCTQVDRLAYIHLYLEG